MSPEMPLAKKVLFISEDNHAVVEQYEMENYLEFQFISTQEAINKLKATKQYEIILLDISRNKQSSLELCRAIKSSVRSRNKLLIIAADKYEFTSEVSAFK